MTNVIESIEKQSKRKRRAAKVREEATPKEALRRIVREHANIIRGIVAAGHQFTPRKFAATKDAPARIEPPGLPTQSQDRYKKLRDELKADKAEVEAQMLNVLREFPVYQTWLKNVAGIGVVTAAYLLAFIDPHKCEKSSQLRRYCGLATGPTGRIERMQAKTERHWNPALRTALYLASVSMLKGNKRTNKYLEIWENAWYRELHSERVNLAENKWRRPDGEWQGGARMHAMKKGRNKAFDRFVEDLYMVLRASEGLPVWMPYYEAKLGYQHGGAPIEDKAPVIMTMDDVFAKIGNADWVERTTERLPLKAEPMDDDEEIVHEAAAAAE